MLYNLRKIGIKSTFRSFYCISLLRKKKKAIKTANTQNRRTILCPTLQKSLLQVKHSVPFPSALWWLQRSCPSTKLLWQPRSVCVDWLASVDIKNGWSYVLIAMKSNLLWKISLKQTCRSPMARSSSAKSGQLCWNNFLNQNSAELQSYYSWCQ